jgi:hypothetical protein
VFRLFVMPIVVIMKARFCAMSRVAPFRSSPPGDLAAPKPANRPRSVLRSHRRKHSQKPDEVYDLIEKMFPELSKIEQFGFTLKRVGCVG